MLAATSQPAPSIKWFQHHNELSILDRFEPRAAAVRVSRRRRRAARRIAGVKGSIAVLAPDRRLLSHPPTGHR